MVNDRPVGHVPTPVGRQRSGLPLMVGDHDPATILQHVSHQSRNRCPGVGVQAGPRFVQNEQARSDEQRLGQPDLLRAAQGQLRQPGFQQWLEVQPPGLPRHRLCGRAGIETTHPSLREQISPSRERLRSREVFRRPPHDRGSKQHHPHGGPQHSSQHPQEGGLARAVATGHLDERTRGQRQRHLTEHQRSPAAVPHSHAAQLHPGIMHVRVRPCCTCRTAATCIWRRAPPAAG